MGPDSNAVAVILAAGESRRMAMPKAMLEFSSGKTFLSHLASVFEAAGCRVLAVIGHGAEQIRHYHPHLELVENANWRDGQFNSALLGLREALSRGASAVLIHPVDVPRIQPDTVRRLLDASSEGVPLVPEYRGTSGHPLLLPRSSAEAVLRGAGPHLQAAVRGMGVRGVPVADSGVCSNINDPAAYHQLFGFPPRTPPSEPSD